MPAKKIRDLRYPQTEFEMPMSEALSLLLKPRDVSDGDQWSFFVRGDVLQITRKRSVEEVPVEDGASAQAAPQRL